MKTADRFTKYHRRLITLAIILPLLAMLVMSTPALAAPVITLSPASGAVGTKVTINGTNFDSYKGDSISITFDGVEIPDSPLVVPDTGIFSVEFTIPDSAEVGRHWINVTSEVGTTTLLARSFFIVGESYIDLDVVDGPTGTEVAISGSGFYAGITVTIYYYNILGEQLGTVVASSIGEFTYNFTVPNSTAGVHKITAQNAEGNSADAEFEVIPSIALNLAASSPGELLTVSGTGFGHRSQVDIDFGTMIVASVRSDEYGNFEVEFNVPEVKSNIYDVKAQDKFGNIDKAKFNVTTGATLNKSTGSVGSDLTVKGSGFTAGGIITVAYDGAPVASTTADNTGAFTVSFDVPISKTGEHIITVTDGATTKMFTFNVESEAPPVPGLLLPSDSSETRSEAYLDWQDVTDLSMPVVYKLQVASDENFSTLVIEKEGLTASEYTLAEAERLAAAAAPAPYFWRVKAMDSANNESEWSAPWSLLVNPPPAPELLHPASDARSEKTVFFNWQPVTNLSPPISYTFQVASDLNFTTTLLEKLALTSSEYYLSEEAELELFKKAEPYYWRVKATDSVNNESDWSVPASFYIDSSFTWPGWATYLLIFIGVIIVVYIAFRVGRRTAYAPPD